MSELNNFIEGRRAEFSTRILTEESAGNNPFHFFEQWMNEAIATEIPEPNAMNLATISSENKPSSRIVYLRGFSQAGLIFYTNYGSRKGIELREKRFASVNFYWQALERQVRIEGKVYKISDKESDDYFASRPRESQISAWASHQSNIISGRHEIERSFIEVSKKYENKAVPRPPFWGGLCLKPDYFEFWQGRENRLHDRIMFESDNNNNWSTYRLSP
jgi:pyridoxamine 5'-phosphate oxidase